SVKIWIMDDDGANCNGCATIAEPGKIPAPQSVEIEQPGDEEDSGKQIKGKSSDSASNAPPTVANHLVDITLVNETAAKDVSLAGVFEDADGDDLTISVASSDETVATASVVPGNKVAVSAKSRGTVEITVTADDGKGGTVSESFNVTVKSAPRVAAGLDESFALEIGVPGVLIMSDLFIDDDGDALSVTAGSSDDDIATATISSDRSTLTVSGVSAGDATIRVIARDPDDNQAVYSFDVSVTAAPQVVVLIPPPEEDSQPQKQTSTPKTTSEPEQKSLQIVVSTAPNVGSTLADVSGLVEGTSRDVSLSGAFADVDGDALTITASSDYTNVATVSVASDYSSLTLTGVSSGAAVITVVAQDTDGNQASQTFNVEVTDTDADPQPQQPQTVTVVQQPTAVPAKDTQDTETEQAQEAGTQETPEQETETQETETEETDTFDAFARYDTNGDGSIDKSEFNQAADDYFQKKIITYSEFVEVYLAHLASSS
ncbi:MAG: Ig-like domain-containing protein, partial [Chloroflexi bacterium]|nr:Ig-like domain-containing protein [Chloroflexota bacterium]